MAGNNLIIPQSLRRAWLHKRWLAIIVILLVAAFVYRIWRLDAQSLWHDEAWSVFQAYQPTQPLDPNYPPAFTLLLGIWIRLVGDSIWAMRYFSVLFGLGMVAVVTLLTRRWFGQIAALLAATLVAASPPLWVFSQEIRSYVAMPLFAVILLALVQSLTKPQAEIPRRTWIWILLVELLALYTHNLAVPLVAWLNVTIILIWAYQRSPQRIAAWLASQTGLLILYMPWLLTQRPTGTPLNTSPKVGLPLLWDIWQSYFTGVKSLLGADADLSGALVRFAIFALIGVVAAVYWHRNRRIILLLSQVILLPFFEVWIIQAAHIDFHPRYVLLGIPATLILIGLGWDAVLQLLFKSSRVVAALLAFAALILALAIPIQVAHDIYSSAGYQHDDFRAIADHYMTLGPDDAIIIPYGWEPTLDYYNRKMGFKARFVSIPLHADANTIINRLRSDLTGVRRAEFFTWYQLPADVRGAYPCLLGTNRALDQALTFSGVHTDGYVAIDQDASLPAVQVFNDTADFGKIRMVGVQSWSGIAGACVVTRWQLTQPAFDQWSALVRVQNPLGWEISRSDTVLLDSAQVPTTRWTLDQTETAFNRFTLPEGTVLQQNYPVTVTAYSATESNGLDVLKDGKIIGKEAAAGTVTHWPNPNEKIVPAPSDTVFGNDTYLHHSDLPQGPLQPGQQLRVTLEWWRTQWGANPVKVTLKLTGQDWSVESDGLLYPTAKVLTWHALPIPATANGTADLTAEVAGSKALPIARYNIEGINRVFTAPTFSTTISADFPTLATLVGVNAPISVQSGQPFEVGLVWKSTSAPTTAYTVFVHLLDANSQVIAQSDSLPANGSRPTTGWIADEYISDNHTLNFNHANYTGTATLEVGLYDAATGKRVTLANGSDHVVLPISVNVK